MSELLDHLRKGYNNPDFVAIKEWANEQGEMGVYQVKIVDELGRGRSVYLYLAVRNFDGTFWYEQYTHGQVSILLKDAGVLAQFANAKEVQSE